MKKTLSLLTMLLLLYGCQSTKVLDIEHIGDYLSDQVTQNECIRNNKVEHKEGYVFFRYYFFDDFPEDDKANVISSTIEYLSQLQVHNDIREYYSAEYNDGKRDRESPILVIEIYNETKNRPLYTYETSLIYDTVEDGRMKYIYRGWSVN